MTFRIRSKIDSIAPPDPAGMERQIGRRTWLLGALMGTYSFDVAAEDKAGYQVIIPAHLPTESLEIGFVADAFLKKRTRWSDSSLIKPVDLRSSSGVRALFSEEVLKRPVVAVRNYWQEKIFSGRDLPPPELDSDLAVIRYVSGHEGAIGYVSVGAKLEGVKKVVLR